MAKSEKTTSTDLASVCLSGDWTLADTSDSDSDDHAKTDNGQPRHVISMQVPGDAISALQLAGKIPDPYWGRNEYQLRWIAERSWSLSRAFSITRTDYDLVISELDTVAQVLINNKLVFQACNQFRHYRHDLSNYLLPGENWIEIRFASSIKAGAELQRSQPWPVPWHAGNSPIPNGNMLRKVQCDFGWDWNIALAPFGLYGKCLLEQHAAARIEAIHIEQFHNDETGVVRVEINPVVIHDQMIGGSTTLDIEFNGEIQQLNAVIGHEVTASFMVESPKLWWPAGSGEQILYPLTVKLGQHTEQRSIGLRTIKLVTEPDSEGSSFYFLVNGETLFMRGANWIPADALPGRITEQKTRSLLCSARDANMNMLRVWGGGRYERDSFYATCDELGLLVWQDFMFSCNLYPATSDFLREVEHEIVDNVSRLHHHACIALWCGDNELIGALTWFPESIENRDRYLVSYDRLNRSIETTLKSVCPSATWWPSSPSPGLLNFGDAWHDDSAGDMHYWSVWHEGRDFDNYRDVSPRFCSEFGFQSWPSLSVVKTFASETDFNIASPVMESHQKNSGGNARIAETLFRYFRFPGDFADSLYLSQIQQGLAIKTAVDHWRSLRPRCMGTLYWQLNDTWPVASWSSLDYGGGWKLMHHMAKQFYQPIHVVATPEAAQDTLKTPDAMNSTGNSAMNSAMSSNMNSAISGWALQAINDQLYDSALSLSISAINLLGQRRRLGEKEFHLSRLSSRWLLNIAADELAADEFLFLQWQTSSGENGTELVATQPFKQYALSPPALRLTVNRAEPDSSSASRQWRLTVSCEALALFVAVESNVPGRFSANAFHVIPDSDAELFFTPDTDSNQPEFTLRDLYSATMSYTTEQKSLPEKSLPDKSLPDNTGPDNTAESFSTN